MCSTMDTLKVGDRFVVMKGVFTGQRGKVKEVYTDNEYYPDQISYRVHLESRTHDDFLNKAVGLFGKLAKSQA